MIETITAGELSFLHDMQQVIGCPTLDNAMTAITRLGDDGLLWIAVAVVLLYFPKTRRTGCQMALAMALCLVLGNGVLKILFARERPFTRDPSIVPLIEKPRDYSFPSGHTMNSFAAAMTMMLRRQKGRYAALTMATLIACSRLYLMVHYPTDVAAGALIGTASAWFSGKVADRTAEKRKRRRLNG